MLPNRKGQSIFTGIARALGDLPLEIDQPVILKYDDKDIIGYYAGFNQSCTKIGLKKKENRLYWKIHMFKAKEIKILTNNIERQHIKSLPLEEQISQLQMYEPVEIVFAQEYNVKFNKQFKTNEQDIVGIIGFWNGITEDRINYLSFHLDKIANKYIDMDYDCQVSKIILDNIRPKFNKIIEVNPLTYLHIN